MLFQTRMLNSIPVYLYSVFHNTNRRKAALQKIEVSIWKFLHYI